MKIWLNCSAPAVGGYFVDKIVPYNVQVITIEFDAPFVVLPSFGSDVLVDIEKYYFV